jgi:CrcB protein
VAAGLGSVLRYVTDLTVQRHLRAGFPFGTLVVNVSGSLLLGLLTGWVMHHGLSSDTALVLGTGLLGGYTTLSTWAWESVALADAGDGPAAALNVAVTVVLGLAAAAAGLGLALL